MCFELVLRQKTLLYNYDTTLLAWTALLLQKGVFLL